MDDTGGMARTKAVARAWAIQAGRDRATLGVVALTLLLIVYDYHYRLPASPLGWWATLAFFVGLVPSVVGYDQYDRLRGDGTLRLFLLQGNARWSIAAGNLLGASLVALAAVAAFVVYSVLVASALVLPELPRAIPFLVLVALAFLAFAQSLSVIIPKDGAAVLVLVVLVFGSSPPERWMPADVSEPIRIAFQVVWAIVPTPIVASRFLRGEAGWPSFGLVVVQCAGWAAVLVRLLGRRALLARKEG